MTTGVLSRPGVSILEAAASGDLVAVRQAVGMSVVSLFDYDDSGCRALHLAASQGHEQIVRLLLEAGADVDQTDKVRVATPLHWATVQGQTAAVSALLEAGADPNAADSTSKTSLLYALEGFGRTLVPWCSPIAPATSYRNISLILLQHASAG